MPPVIFARAALRFASLALGCAICLAGVSACAKAKAASIAESQPLVVPPAPPRMLAPVEEPLAATPATPEPPAAAAPRTPARPPVRRATQPPVTEPESRPEPAPVVAAPATPPPSEPARELRPAQSAADAAEEKRLRDVLNKAGRDLNRVNYQRLSPDGRSQYEQAKRFSDQAEAALRERNFVYASTLADKAALIATELVGR